MNIRTYKDLLDNEDFEEQVRKAYFGISALLRFCYSIASITS